MKYDIKFNFGDEYLKNSTREKFTTSLDIDLIEGIKAYKKATKIPVSKMLECIFHEILSDPQKQIEFALKVRKYKGIHKTE